MKTIHKAEFLMWQEVYDNEMYWSENKGKIQGPFLYYTRNGRLGLSKTRILDRVMCRHYGITHYCLVKLPEGAIL